MAVPCLVSDYSTWFHIFMASHRRDTYSIICNASLVLHQRRMQFQGEYIHLVIILQEVGLLRKLGKPDILMLSLRFSENCWKQVKLYCKTKHRLWMLAKKSSHWKCCSINTITAATCCSARGCKAQSHPIVIWCECHWWTAVPSAATFETPCFGTKWHNLLARHHTDCHDTTRQQRCIQFRWVSQSTSLSSLSSILSTSHKCLTVNFT